MSRTGNCWDNAPVESFFSTLKAEALPDRPWVDAHDAVGAIAEYSDFYNRRRLHPAHSITAVRLILKPRFTRPV
jgi:transposase InsO family protein